MHLRSWRVLDHGSVELVDYMGDDQRVVDAARVSVEGMKTVTPDDKLIHFLMRSGHTSPFEQVVFTFIVQCPIFVARQWVRHRTARLNEVSGRYSILPDKFYIPREEDVRAQSRVNKQLGDGDLPQHVREAFVESVKDQSSIAYANYATALAWGVSREQARMALPLNIYTRFMWQMDLHNLLHFLEKRLAINPKTRLPEAQWEIRQYGYALEDLIRPIVPVTMNAWWGSHPNLVPASTPESWEPE